MGPFPQNWHFGLSTAERPVFFHHTVYYNLHIGEENECQVL